MLGRGIGAMICERFASEGCNIAVNYLSSEDSAKEVAAKVEKHSVKAIVVQGVCPIANHDVKRNSMLSIADCLRMPVSAPTMQEWSNLRLMAWAGSISSLPTQPGPGSRTSLGTSKMG
jgi:NAD(P)-dependent dehydrogenase (short-subunit alcohol dehydrogenase family)